MKILFLTYHFAPYNHIGAVRCVKTAKYLTQMGDQVRVLAAADQPFSADLDAEIDTAHITHVQCPHLDGVASKVSTHNRAGGRSTSSGLSMWRMLLRKAYQAFKVLTWYPDNVAFWRTGLLKAARREVQTFQPDIILASGPPFTPLVVAAQLSRESGIPWVCELRDLWVDNHNYPFPRWRRHFEQKMEQRTLRGASAIITVSEPLKQKLKRKYSTDIQVITNGFDPNDYHCIQNSPFSDDQLNIVYTGFIYRERQDINPLLLAMRHLDPAVDKVRLHLFGRSLGDVTAHAEALGIAEAVFNHGSISHKKALAAQRAADCLLYLSWNDPCETGVFSGKLFEYLGARRHILCVGTAANVATDLIIERAAGHVSGDPVALAVILRELCAQKRAYGRSADLPISVGQGFTRQEQVARLRQVLADALLSDRMGAT